MESFSYHIMSAKHELGKAQVQFVMYQHGLSRLILNIKFVANCGPEVTRIMMHVIQDIFAFDLMEILYFFFFFAMQTQTFR